MHNRQKLSYRRLENNATIQQSALCAASKTGICIAQLEHFMEMSSLRLHLSCQRASICYKNLCCKKSSVIYACQNSSRSVCDGHMGWPCNKQLNRFRCYLEADCRGPKELRVNLSRFGCHLMDMTERSMLGSDTGCKPSTTSTVATCLSLIRLLTDVYVLYSEFRT